MHTVPTDPPPSSSTYDRIQRMSSDISSSPTCFDRAAASSSSSGDFHAPRLRITYVSMAPSAYGRLAHLPASHPALSTPVARPQAERAGGPNRLRQHEQAVAELVPPVAVAQRLAVRAVQHGVARRLAQQLEVRGLGLVPAGDETVDRAQPALGPDHEPRPSRAVPDGPVRRRHRLERPN